MRLVKFKREDHIYPEYGIIENEKVRPIKGKYQIAELFHSIKSGNITTGRLIPLHAVHPIPPTDPSVRIYCAGLNYHDHAREINMSPPQTPVFFSKVTGALTGPNDFIIYPESTSLLDYEVELALIVGKKITENDFITPSNLPDYILGITVLNDISARDHQLRAGQWFMGKNFRTFAPLGPYIEVLENHVNEKLYNLEVMLQVFTENGVAYPYKKQHGNTKDMIFSINKLINSLSERFDLLPGDVISTGTPHGVAMSNPGRIKSRLSEILGIKPQKMIELFLDHEKKNNNRYLAPGDIITARIFSADGIINCGSQKNPVIQKNSGGPYGIPEDLEGD